MVGVRYHLRVESRSEGLILSFRGYLGVLLGLVFRYLSLLGLFLQILVVFGVLDFVGWGEFCVWVGLVVFCGVCLIFFLFWYVCMVGGKIIAYRGLFEVFVFELVFYWVARFIFWTHFFLGSCLWVYFFWSMPYCPLWIVLRCPCFARGCSLFFGLMGFLVFYLWGVGFLFDSDSDECPMPSLAARKRLKPFLRGTGFA